MKKLFWILVFLITSPCFSQDGISQVLNPKEVTSEVRSYSDFPKDIEGIQWHRWTSKNFVVCSTNNIQAQYLHRHLELVKGWAFSRWGLIDIDFSKECKMICVDDPILYKKLFGITNTKVEIRREENGSIKETVIFVLLNGSPSECVPMPLTQVCLAEFGQKYDTKMPLWSIKGMSKLNGSLQDIKKTVLFVGDNLRSDHPLFFSKSLMEMDEEKYRKLSEQDQILFDDCATIFCLMVRKEFGKNSFLKLLKFSSEKGPEKALREVLKFESYGHFDKSFKSYMEDLDRDIQIDKTPDQYLQIKELER